MFTQYRGLEGGLKEGYVSPGSLGLRQSLGKVSPSGVLFGPQHDVFQSTISEKSNERHEFHMRGLLNGLSVPRGKTTNLQKTQLH